MGGAQSRPQIGIAGDAHFTGGTFNNVEHQTVVSDSAELKDLKTHSTPAAIHTSREVDGQGICTPGTRTRTLKHIQNLLTTSNTSPDIIWMHGPAGAGKSAIMRTTTQHLDKEDTLLASFFFFRSETKRNTSIPFIPTLALHAFDNLPQTQSHILHSIRQHPTVFSQAPHLQSRHLLQTPLINFLRSSNARSGWPSSSPYVIVVDGLDECMDDGGQEGIIRALAELTSTIRARTKRRLKILVASRPELRIKTEFERLHSQGEAEVISLDSSDAELHLFYEERFAEIRRKYPSLGHWPSVKDREWLMDKTSGQYSFADVSTRHLAGGDPVHRLQALRKAFVEDGVNPFQPLDVLYTTIFQQLPPEMLQPALLILQLRLGTNPTWYFRYSLVLEPLFQLPQGFLFRLSPHLSSLIDFNDNLRLYHASLSDFLRDPRRSGSLAFATYDSLFSRTFTKGLFVLLSAMSRQPGSVDQQTFNHLVFDMKRIITLHKEVPLYPNPENYPSKQEITALINTVDISLFGLFHFSYFTELSNIIHPLYIDSSTPDSVIALSLNHRMEATWQEKTASYGQCTTGDLVIGLMLLSVTAAHGNYLVHTMVGSFIKHIIQSNKELRAADTAGWKLMELPQSSSSMYSDTYLQAICQYEDATYSTKCLQLVFDAILDVGDGKDVHPLVADFIHSGEVASLDELQRCIVCCWCWSGYTLWRSVFTLAQVNSVYRCIQNGDWASQKLTNDVRVRASRIPGFPIDDLLKAPSFSNPEEEQVVRMYRGLEEKLEYFKRAEADLGRQLGDPRFYQFP